MIQALIPAAPPVPEVPAAPAAPAAPGKSFSSVLKTSVQQSAGSADDAKNTSVKETVSKDCPVAPCHSSSKASDGANDSDVMQETSSDKQSRVVRIDQDTSEILRQFILQLAAVYQQAVNQPTGNSAGAESTENLKSEQDNCTTLMVDAAAATIPDDEEKAAVAGFASSKPTGNIFAVPAADKGDTAGKTELKSSEKYSAGGKDILFDALKGSANDNPMNTVIQSSDSDRAEAGLQSFRQAGGSYLSKAVASNSDDMTKFTIESSSGSSDAGDWSNIRGTTGLYAQGVQGQNASIHEHAPVQETLPANRLSSIDAIISRAVDSGQKNLVLRIDPPDLGSLHIRLSLDNGILKADVRVDSSSVRDSFNLALPQIKTSLENAGIKVSEFNVDVREDQYRDGQGRNNQGHQQRQGRGLKNGFSDFFA